MSGQCTHAMLLFGYLILHSVAAYSMTQHKVDRDKTVVIMKTNICASIGLKTSIHINIHDGHIVSQINFSVKEQE